MRIWAGCWGSLLYLNLSSECHAGEAWWSTEPHSKINIHFYWNDPNRNTHPSKPGFIKVVHPSSNYRITGQPAGQTQQGPLVGCSCPKTHWSLYLVTQVSTHKHTHSCTNPKHSFTQYPYFSLSLQDAIHISQTHTEAKQVLHLGKYSADRVPPKQT